MRRKIAKIRRKDVLALGAVITREFWDNGQKEYDAPRIPKIAGRRDDCAYVVKADFNGWHILSVGYDELEAWQMTLWCVKDDWFKANAPDSI